MFKWMFQKDGMVLEKLQSFFTYIRNINEVFVTGENECKKEE